MLEVCRNSDIARRAGNEEDNRSSSVTGPDASTEHFDDEPANTDFGEPDTGAELGIFAEPTDVDSNARSMGSIPVN